MIKNGDRHYGERDKMSREKKIKLGQKILAIAVDQSMIHQQTNQRINLKAGSVILLAECKTKMTSYWTNN